MSGITRLSPSSVYGVVSIQTLSGFVSSVPDLESNALMLTGLGLVGAVARHRNQQLSSEAR